LISKQYEIPPPLKKEIENIVEQENKPVDRIESIIETTTKSVLKKPVIITNKSKVIEPKKLNFATLNSSIKDVIEQDNLKIQQAWNKDCYSIQMKHGSEGCVPLIERLGLKMDDPYGLSKIFKGLHNDFSSKKHQRIIAKLITKETTVNAILENENLDDNLRAQFSDELNFLRGEIQYQECGGDLHSGTCAGEVDLIKLGNLLISLFGN